MDPDQSNEEDEPIPIPKPKPPLNKQKSVASKHTTPIRVQEPEP